MKMKMNKSKIKYNPTKDRKKIIMKSNLQINIKLKLNHPCPRKKSGNPMKKNNKSKVTIMKLHRKKQKC